MDITSKFEFAGFWKRVLAALIDAAIGWSLLPITLPMMFWCFRHRTIVPNLLFSVVWTVIFLYLVVHFGGTPGKLIVRLRIVEKSGNFLSWKAAIMRIIPYIIISLNSNLQMHTVLHNFPGFVGTPSFFELGNALNEYGGIYNILATIFGLFIYVDVGTILFNKKKRAIHDFIAGSYVITKASYLKTNLDIDVDETIRS